MGTSIIQPAFAAGELAPSLYARTDLAKYQSGLKLCSNFTVTPYGGVKNRAGMVFVNESKTSSKKARLVPFAFNDQQTYVLEFGDLYMRVYKDGGIVLAGGGGVYEIATTFTEADLADLNFTQSADVMTLVHPSYTPKKLSRLDHNNWTLADISFLPAVAAPASANCTAVAGTGNSYVWRYQITAVLDKDGVIDESLPVTSDAGTTHADKMRATVTWPAAAVATYYNVYKDNTQSGVYGFVGRASGLTFTDINITPAKTDTPPTGANPFVGAGNYPGAVGYYQQRLIFAGSNNSPQTVWMSKVGNFSNFGYATPTKDDDSITLTVASTKVNRFRHLLPIKQLIGLTTGGEWEVSGAESGLTAKTVSAQVQSYNGSAKIRPIVINSSAIYVQTRGNSVLSLAYSFEADGFNGEDLTKYATHFFRGFTLVDWAFQQTPDRIVWAVRSDGALLGMTFLPEEKLIAWHQHHTDGFVESVCSIAEGDEDALYLLVRRTINGVSRRYIERMASRTILDIENAKFVDCALTYDGRNTDTADFMTLSGGTTWQSPEALTLTASGHAPFTVGSVGRIYRLRAGIELVRVKVTAYTSTTVVIVQLIEACPASLRTVAVSDWALMATTISGLAHIEGKTVSILADGDVHPQRVVTGGAITLQSAAAVAHVGLPYVAELETLEVSIVGSETLLDKRKVIPGVTAFIEASRNFWAGPKQGAKLYEQKPDYRGSYNAPIGLVTGISSIKINTSWGEDGRIYIQQPDPLPLSILALIPDVVASGKG
jgi:hypothetical protein